MAYHSKMFLCFSGIILTLLLGAILLPSESKVESKTLRIGAGDDVSGLLLEKLLEESSSVEQIVASSFYFADC